MFKAAGRSLSQLNHSLPGGGSRWCPGGLDRRVALAHVLSTSKWGAAPPASSPALCLHSGGGRESLDQFSFESPVKCQQLRFYRSGRVSRSIEQEKPQPQKASPQLMEFPWVVWPSLWHSIRNWIFANLLIHRYLDQEFDMTSFKRGAIQALVYVSQELSKGNFEALEGLVTTPSLEEIKKNFAHFSLKQRLDLAVEKEDIFFSFPYQIGMIFTNEGTTHERIFVEITMCYHVFRGFQEYVNSPSASEGGLRAVYDNHERISIANYRFIREFTKGVVDDWTISLANHFKPGEHLQRQ
uniref:Juvenile hormone esterase binding protein n=1 Tax=Scylla paramamosain TaxID=85552 RepID=A0A3S5WLH9_SCYPA|nr:juvenile hormone esterase binding protein [Scylla paramamosain]